MTVQSLNPSGGSQEPQATVSMDSIQDAKDAKKLVAWVHSAYQDMKNARTKQKMQWDLNLAFYFGNQYIEFLTAVNKLTVPKAPPYRVRMTVNRVKPLVRTEVARLTSQKPSASVVPASSEDSDLAAAYAAEQVWESISYYGKLHAKYREAAFWTSVCGNGFIKTWYDPQYLTDATEVPGAVQYACVTPYHLFAPDLRTVELQDQPYILNLYPVTVAKAKAMWGKQLEGVDLQATDRAEEIISDTIFNLNSARNNAPDSVLVYEMWIKPGGCEHLPNGGMITIVGETIVQMHKDGIPYKHGKFPFTKFDHIPTGKFYSDSPVMDVIPVQREYNRTRSQIVEAKNRMAKPQLMAPRGSIEVNKITSEPGQVILYRPGMAPPQPLPLQPLPAYVSQDLDRSLMDIEDMTGQHQVSKGNVPSGVTAATAISYLQEKDDSIMSTAYASVEEGMEDIAKQTLYLIQQFWDVQRTIKVTGADNSFDVIQLAGSDICTDIRMEGGSALPVSKSARQAFLMDLMKMGFIPPDKGLQLMDIGGVQQLNRQLKVDQDQATRENIRMKSLDPMAVEQYTQQWDQQEQMRLQQQMQVPVDPSMDPAAAMDMMQPQPAEPLISVNTWDNHAVHVEVHNNFRKTQAFELLPDPIKAQFESHVNMHLNAMSDAFGQAQQFAGLMGGGGMPPEMGGDPSQMPTDPMAGGMPSG